MVFKGANNNSITLYARAPVANATTGCNNPATNTGGSATVLFTGSITNQPAASPYGADAHGAQHPHRESGPGRLLRDHLRGASSRRGAPPGTSPLKVQAVFDYIPAGDPTDTISPPYAGTTDPCPP